MSYVNFRLEEKIALCSCYAILRSKDLMRTLLKLPKQAGLPAWLDGAGRLVDQDGEVLDKYTFIRMREELGAKILTNARGKVTKALGFSRGGAAGIVRAVEVPRFRGRCAGCRSRAAVRCLPRAAAAPQAPDDRPNHECAQSCSCLQYAQID